MDNSSGKPPGPKAKAKDAKLLEDLRGSKAGLKHFPKALTPGPSHLLQPTSMSTEQHMLVELMNTWRLDELELRNRTYRNGDILQEWVDAKNKHVYARYVMSADGKRFKRLMIPTLRLQ